MKRCLLGVLVLAALLLCGCGRDAGLQEERPVRVGFSQLGSESDWRMANTGSMTAALSEENGFELLFDNEQRIAITQMCDSDPFRSVCQSDPCRFIRCLLPGFIQGVDRENPICRGNCLRPDRSRRHKAGTYQRKGHSFQSFHFLSPSI